MWGSCRGLAAARRRSSVLDLLISSVAGAGIGGPTQHVHCAMHFLLSFWLIVDRPRCAWRGCAAIYFVLVVQDFRGNSVETNTNISKNAESRVLGQGKSQWNAFLSRFHTKAEDQGNDLLPLAEYFGLRSALCCFCALRWGKQHVYVACD